MTGLRTTAPSGVPGWPMVLVESEPKGGGTFTALGVSMAAEVDRTFVVDLDGTADGYADVGPFELVDHNGTLEDISDQIAAASGERSVDGKVNALVVDQVSTLWPAVVAWGDARARRGKKNRQVLDDDPDAEVRIPDNIWSDVRDRWRSFVEVCRRFPGPVVWVARGGPDDRGRWQTTCQHDLIREATVWVRCHRDPRSVWMVGCELLTGNVTVPVELPLLDTLPTLLFDELQPQKGYGPRRRTAAVPEGLTRKNAKAAFVTAVARTLGLSPAEASDEAARLWALSGLQEFPTVTDDQYRQLLVTIGTPPESPVEESAPHADGVDTPPPGEPVGEVEPPPVPSPADPPDTEAAA